MTTFSFFEPIKMRGMFWIPENPEDKMVGELFYEPGERIDLDLFGRFEIPGETLSAFEEAKPEVILGTTATGKEITLFKVYSNGMSVTTGGYQRSQFTALQLFIGAHLCDPNSCLFSKATVNLTYLEDWLVSRPFEYRDSQKKNMDGTSVRFGAPRPRKWVIKSIGAVIETGYSMTTGGDGWTKVEWKFAPTLTIVPDEKRDIIWFTKTSYTLSNFISLMVGHRSSPRTFCLLYETNNKKKRVDFIWLNRDSKIKLRKSIHPGLILARHPDVFRRMTKILDSFFKDEQRLGAVYGDFFSYLFNSESYVEAQFLSIVQALEQYHRRRSPKQYLSDANFSKVKAIMTAAIPSGLPKDFKQALESKIAYSNECSLRTRLKLLLEPLDEEIKNSFFPSSKKFIGFVVETRNRLIHGSENNSNEEINSPNELSYVVERLRVLLLIYLLKDIKIPISIYRKALFQRYLWLAKRIKATVKK